MLACTKARFGRRSRVESRVATNRRCSAVVARLTQTWMEAMVVLDFARWQSVATEQQLVEAGARPRRNLVNARALLHANVDGPRWKVRAAQDVRVQL